METEQVTSEIRPWVVERLRVTAFPVNPADIEKNAPSWESLTGEAPAKVEQRPRDRVIVSEGPFERGTLVHVQTPDRIELAYMAGAEGAAALGSMLTDQAMPNLGALETVLAEFSPLLEKWMASLPAIKRLAFGPVLFMPAQDHEDAYRKLNELLPAVRVDPTTSDFSYRINRRRDAESVPGLAINRLSTWNAIRLRLFAVAGGESHPVEAYGCRAELDINTSQDRVDAISSDSLLSLLAELEDMAIELAKGGDVP